MKSAGTALLLAFSMLTRLPLHPRGEVTPAQLRWSVAFYPWVGLVLGGVLALAAPTLRDLGMPEIAGLLGVAWLALITGGLHLDGVADWFDALGGGRGDRDRMLEIMKDSRIGAHGAVALILVLLGKWQALSVAITALSGWELSLMPAISRAAIVPLVAFMSPAREQGLARSVHGAHAWPITCVALGSLCALIAALGLHRLWLPLAYALVTAVVIGLWAQRRLGGATGDVYGAALELSEVVALIAAGSITQSAA